MYGKIIITPVICSSQVLFAPYDWQNALKHKTTPNGCLPLHLYLQQTMHHLWFLDHRVFSSGPDPKDPNNIIWVFLLICLLIHLPNLRQLPKIPLLHQASCVLPKFQPGYRIRWPL